MTCVLKNNNHLIADGLLLTSAILAAKGSPKAKWLMAAGGAILWGQSALGITKLANNSCRTVFCKVSNSDEVRECPPHSEIYDIDAFAVDGKVYKISNGAHMSVNETGRVCFCSVSAALIQNIKGVELTTPPDENFMPLFDIAGVRFDAIGMSKPAFIHLKLQHMLFQFLSSNLTALNEPISTDKYDIEVLMEWALGVNGHGLVPDVMIGKKYNNVKKIKPTPYVIIEIEACRVMSDEKKKDVLSLKEDEFPKKLSNAVKKIKDYLAKYPDLPNLEVFLLDYVNRIWFTCDRNGKLSISSYCKLLNADLDKGVKWKEIDNYLCNKNRNSK